jgi:ABC-2 type transport system ATP-binding protein
MSTSEAVFVQGLTKHYGDFEAVAGIDLSVAQGSTFGFLGPNGAGKSTTIRILCTLSEPTSGTARVAGFDVLRERAAVRRHIGLVFQDPTLDTYLTGEQNLRFHAELYGIPKAVMGDRMKEVLDMVGLWDRRKAKVMTYSGGMRRRLEIARGLMHSPRVLFLDEPTVGLDPQTRASIWGYLHELREREDITIFLTTHYMDEAEHCDQIAIVDHGSIVAEDSPAALKASIGTDKIRIETTDNAAAIIALKTLFSLDATQQDDTVVFNVPDGERFVPRLFAESSIPIRSVHVARPTLDDVFMSYTGRTIRDSDATAADGNRAFAQAFRR